jgi:hypothetical protein
MPNLAIGPISYAIIVRDTRPSSAPFRPTRACSPCLGKSRRAALPCALLARLAAHLERTGKMLLTDLCNRHSIRAPVYRPIPAPAACAAKSASEMSPEREPRAIRSAASDHLAAIRPRVELRLTTPLQLRTNRLHPSSYENEERKSSTRRWSFSGVAFSAAPRVDDSASDAPVAPRESPLLSLHEAPGSLPLPARQREQLSRPEAPSVDKCSLSLSRRKPATVPSALPPWAGFRRSFAPLSALAG